MVQNDDDDDEYSTTLRGTRQAPFRNAILVFSLSIKIILCRLRECVPIIFEEGLTEK